MVKFFTLFRGSLLVLFLFTGATIFAQSGVVHITTVQTDNGWTIIEQNKINTDNNLEASIFKYFKLTGADEAANINVLRKIIKEQPQDQDEPLFLKTSKAVSGILLHYKATENVAAVRSILKDSPADKAGLLRGDIIKQVAGQPVNNLMDFINILCPLEGGDPLLINFEREGVAMQKTITLDDRAVEYLNPVYMDHKYESMATDAVLDFIKNELRNNENLHQISLSWGQTDDQDRMLVFQVSKDEQQVNKNDFYLTLNDLTVVPNPTNGRLYISFTMDEMANTEILVLNALGKEIYHERLGTGNHYNKMIDLSSYPKGIYFVQLSQNHKMINKKIIVQ